MITNLLAGIVVSIVTNTAEKVTGYANYVPGPCPDAVKSTNGIRDSCLVLHWEGVDPNQITTTTTAELRTVLQFEWMGQVKKVEHVEVLWQSNVVKNLKWVASQ